MPRQQKKPRNPYTTVQTSLLAQTCHRVKTLDLLERAGYSRTLARTLLRERRVWEVQPRPNHSVEWTLAKDTTLLDFLDSKVHEYVLVIQAKPYLKGWKSNSRVITARAQPLTLLDKIRYWLVRRVWDREWLLPPLGTL